MLWIFVFPSYGLLGTQSGVYEAKRKPTELIVLSTAPYLFCLLLTFQRLLLLIFFFNIKSLAGDIREKYIYFVLPKLEVCCPTFNDRYVLRSMSDVKMVKYRHFNMHIKTRGFRDMKKGSEKKKDNRGFSEWHII